MNRRLRKRSFLTLIGSVIFKSDPGVTFSKNQEPIMPLCPSTDEANAWQVYRHNWVAFLENLDTHSNDQKNSQYSNDDFDVYDTYRIAWIDHWHRLDQSWRIEPEIDYQRQTRLTELLKIQSDPIKGIYPFKNMKLSRADIEWLLATHENGKGAVDWDDEIQREREGLDLRGADLDNENLSGLPLACMKGGLPANNSSGFEAGNHFREAAVHMRKVNLQQTHLEGACLHLADLEGADLYKASLQKADLSEISLKEANLMRGDFTGASLSNAHLEKANLKESDLEKASLRDSHLEGAILERANLKGCDLRSAFFDIATNLRGTSLIESNREGILLAGTHFNSVDLTIMNWDQLELLGDEIKAQRKESYAGQIKLVPLRVREFRLATQANQQLALTLHSQGMNEPASFFAYRSQITRRKMNYYQILQNLSRLQQNHRKLFVYLPLLLIPISFFLLGFIQSSGFFASPIRLFESHMLFLLTLILLPYTIFVHSSQWLERSSRIISTLESLYLFLTLLIFLFFIFLNCAYLCINYLYSSFFILFILIVISAFFINMIWRAIAMLMFIVIFYIPLFVLLLLGHSLIEQVFAVVVFILLGISLPIFYGSTIRPYKTSGPGNRRTEQIKKSMIQYVIIPIRMAFRIFKDLIQYIFSLFLDGLAGYGYKPERTIFWYLIIISAFTIMYASVGPKQLPALEALVFSVTSFHGRGFFPSPISLSDPRIVLAALEAVIGLLIEISFISTFTQRFFGKI